MGFFVRRNEIFPVRKFRPKACVFDGFRNFRKLFIPRLRFLLLISNPAGAPGAAHAETRSGADQRVAAAEPLPRHLATPSSRRRLARADAWRPNPLIGLATTSRLALVVRPPGARGNADLAPTLGAPTSRNAAQNVTPVGFEPTQFALVELEPTPLDHSGKVSIWTKFASETCLRDIRVHIWNM